MKRINSLLVAVVFVALGSVGCGKDGPLPGPSPIPNPPPTPVPTPGPAYDTIGERIYLLNESGERTKMWIMLHAETSPARGATVILGRDRFSFAVEFGLEELPNPNAGAFPEFSFSDDDLYHKEYRIVGFVVRSGKSDQTNMDWSYPLPGAFKYIVVSASYQGSVNGTYGTFPGEAGTAKLILDHK